MNKDDLQVACLIFSYIQGKLSVSQSAELARWIESGENNRELFEHLVSSASFRDKLEVYRRFEQYYNYRQVQTAVFRKRRLRLRRIAVAATLIGIIAAGTTLVLNNGRHTDDTIAVYDGVFGSANRATLTLGTGECLSMDTIDEEFLQKDGSLIRLGAGGLSYDNIAEGGEKIWHSIAISRGGEYMVTLSDGTRIWLNSASNLNYPLKFSDNERRVTLRGEAYFEVAHDSDKPFIVESDGQRVVVLGTKFNVNAYDNEVQIITTLIEGSIRVETSFGDDKALVPGNQSCLNKESGHLNICIADTDGIATWKDGLFSIEEQSLHQILRQLTRWYDVEFTVDESVPENMTFKGSLPKYQNIESTIKRLELISNLKMKIHGKTIRVSK